MCSVPGINFIAGQSYDIIDKLQSESASKIILTFWSSLVVKELSCLICFLNISELDRSRLFDYGVYGIIPRVKICWFKFYSFGLEFYFDEIFSKKPGIISFYRYSLSFRTIGGDLGMISLLYRSLDGFIQSYCWSKISPLSMMHLMSMNLSLL